MEFEKQSKDDNMTVSTVTGDIAELTQKIKETLSISVPTQTPSISVPTQTPSISVPTQTPPIPVPTQTPSISVPTQTPSISESTQTPSISVPTQTPSISVPTQTRITSISEPKKFVDLPVKENQPKEKTPRKRGPVKLEKEPNFMATEGTKFYDLPLFSSILVPSHLWIFSFNRQSKKEMGTYYTHVKQQLSQYGWFDLGNSSYLKWTNEQEYNEIANELFWVLTQRKQVQFLSYVTLIRSGPPIPINYSKSFVDDLKGLLWTGGQAITHTQNEHNAFN